MTEFERVFRENTAVLQQEGVFCIAADMAFWKMTFEAMHWALESRGCSKAGLKIFQSAISGAIDTAGPDDLSGPERVALQAALLSAFDGVGRLLPTTLAPKATFLRHVRFSE